MYFTQEDIQYLEKNQIRNAVCNTKDDFAFISYAHDARDSAIVYEVFRKLHSRGYNLWIDSANMPHDRNSWKTFADAAMDPNEANCKLLLLFRSEVSMTKDTIQQEVTRFSELEDVGDNIFAIDIYRQEGLHTKDLAAQIADDPKKTAAYTGILKIVNQSCNAIRLREDCQGDVDRLVSAIAVELQQHGIYPKFSLQDKIVDIMNGDFDVHLEGDQLRAFCTYKKMLAQCAKDGKKRTLIVRGDPGSGKSVLSMKMLIEARRQGKGVVLVSKNEAPRNAYLAVLEQRVKAAKAAGDKVLWRHLCGLRDEAKEILKGSASFYNCAPNKYDVVLVDEAHRLIERSQYTPKGGHQVREMVNAGRLTVFFYDPRQIVTTADIGSVTEILKWCKELNVERPEGIRLRTQCRCNGSNDYIDWLDSVLGYDEDMGLFITQKSDFELKLFDSPTELYGAIIQKNGETDGSARLIAGYCWDWNTTGRDDTTVHNISIDDAKAPNGKFTISWNLTSDDSYAKEKNSINEAGSIHTVQGLEFLYAGVIIGTDMIYEDGRVKTNALNRAKTDTSLKGLLGKIKQSQDLAKAGAKNIDYSAEITADRLIRNTYRILMTRGVKGCYLYCCDSALQEYVRKKIDEYNAKEQY